MPKGGARTRSGPPPDPNALRRDRRSDGEWTVLPLEVDAEPPAWPLTEQSERESELWVALWRKPQAVLWARNQQAEQVAMYVRCFAEAEQPEAATALRTLVRQQADALLLTIPAMHSARVRIASDELAPARASRPVVAERPSARDRLKVAVGGDA